MSRNNRDDADFAWPTPEFRDRKLICVLLQRYVPSSTKELYMSRVVSLHIQLLVRSSHENLNTDIVPYIYNEITHTPVDKRLRKVFSSTITLRNNIE